jgi:hypothetical protein
MMFNLIRHALSEFRIPGCRMTKVHIETLQPIEITDTTTEWLPYPAAPGSSAITMVVTDLHGEFHLTLDLCSQRFDLDDGRRYVREYLDELRRLCKNLSGHLVGKPMINMGQIYDDSLSRQV